MGKLDIAKLLSSLTAARCRTRVWGSPYKKILKNSSLTKDKGESKDYTVVYSEGRSPLLKNLLEIKRNL